jgi:hypothetical protein
VDLTEWVIGWEVEGICFVVEPMEVFKAEWFEVVITEIPRKEVKSVLE